MLHCYRFGGTSRLVGYLGITSDLVPVLSTSLLAVGYDADTSNLVIEFRNGQVHQYFGVPASVHASLMTAPSIGRYFAQNIKPTYPSTRLQ